jgi:L-seryl-tRNA(Ser) seleniumtransferase
MLAVGQDRLRQRGRRLLRRLARMDKIEAVMREDVSLVGGGSLPLQALPTMVIAIKPCSLSVNDLEKRLREGSPPIISRIHKEELVLDLRTIFDEEIPLVEEGIGKALINNAEHHRGG